MAFSTPINAVTVAPNATSATADLSLTAPVTGVEFTIAAPAVGSVAPIAGVVVYAQTSVDGTTFSAPVKVAETCPGEERGGYHDAKNCAKVRYSVHNRDTSVSVSATLVVIQV